MNDKRYNAVCAALGEYALSDEPLATTVECIDNDGDALLCDVSEDGVTCRYLFTFDADERVLTCHSANEGEIMQLMFHYDDVRTLHVGDVG